METPVFTKREPRPYDYQEMTWGKFLKLREWAKKTAQELGYPIYLVGSVLQKEVPRDFDVVMTIPEKEFEERFGVMTESNFGEVLVKSFNAYVREYFDCEETFACEESIKHHGYVPLDFKVYPDNWFPNGDRLILGEPKKFTNLK
jgi:hypothetical protein